MADKRLELADEFGVAAGGEQRVKAVFLSREPQLLESVHLSLSERLEGEVGQRRPPPERERLVESCSGRGGARGEELLPSPVRRSNRSMSSSPGSIWIR